MALFRRTSSGVISLRPSWHRFVAAGVADAAKDLFCRGVFRIVSGVAGPYCDGPLCLAECAYPRGDIGGGDSRWWRGTKRSAPRTTCASVPFEIDSADDGFADLRPRLGRCSSISSSMNH